MTTLIIEEIGTGRSVELQGRALPFRGVAFGTQMRSATTWYAGSNTGTMQVLGAEEPDVDMEGKWSDKFMNGSVFANGFDVEVAADLVAIFTEWAASGANLRLQWGPQVRNGIIAEFTPTYDREADINWSVVFTWFGRDDAEPQPAFVQAEPDSRAPTLAAMNELDEEAAMEPPLASRDYVEGVRDSVDSIRATVKSYVDSVQAAASLSAPGLGDINAVIADALQIGVDVKQRIRQASEPITETILSQRPTDRLVGDLSRRTVSARAHELRSVTARAAQRLSRRARPRDRVVVTVAQGQTLRSLALVHYGTADEWRRIATANGITRSTLQAGSRVVIPSLADPTTGAC